MILQRWKDQFLVARHKHDQSLRMARYHFSGDIESCDAGHIHIQKDHMIRRNRQLFHKLARIGEEMRGTDPILLGKFNLNVLPEILRHRRIVIADGNGKVHLSICLSFV